jgi:hypothetical protein
LWVGGQGRGRECSVIQRQPPGAKRAKAARTAQVFISSDFIFLPATLDFRQSLDAAALRARILPSAPAPVAYQSKRWTMLRTIGCSSRPRRSNTRR